MVEAIRIRDLSYIYPGRSAPSLFRVNLVVEEGEFVLAAGATGSGKSTLARALTGLIPREAGGTMEGVVYVGGLDTRKAPVAEIAKHAGIVFQSPEDQVFSTVVEEEIAFGMENLQVSPSEMDHRIDEALEVAGLAGMRNAPTATLSGGQKQRLAVASVIAMRSRILVLDEPTSQLDPRGSRELLETLRTLNLEMGLTIFLIEHRIHQAAQFAGRMVLLDQGRLILDKPVQEAFRDTKPFREAGVRIPDSVEIAELLGLRETPLSVEELLPLLVKPTPSGRLDSPCRKDRPESVKGLSATTVVRAEEISFGYSKDKKVLDGISFEVKEGESLAILGANAAGKSTLLMLLAGGIRPKDGVLEVLARDMRRERRFSLAGELGLLLQNPDLMLIGRTVEEELAFGPENLGLSADEVRERVETTLSTFRISRFRKENPLSLSRGERLRVAVAATVALRPKLLLLDEPTTGQDIVSIESMMEFLCGGGVGSARLTAGAPREGNGTPHTLIFCTHDVSTAARYARRIIILGRGRILADGTPEETFAKEEILRLADLEAPPVFRLSRGLSLPPAFVASEFVKQVGFY